MNIFIKFIIILFVLYLIIKLYYSFTDEHFYLKTQYDNILHAPYNLTKRYWQQYQLDKTVDMNY